MPEKIAIILQPRQDVVNLLHQLAIIGAVVTVLVGFLNLISWQFDVSFLEKSFPLTRNMNPLSAVVFICAGCSLFSLLLEYRNQDRVMKSIMDIIQLMLSIITALIGFLMVLHFIGIAHINLDQILYANKLAGNRISPNSSINFFFIGTALLFLQFHTKKYFIRITQILTLLVAVISMFAVIGYIYNALSLYRVTFLTPMPLSSAITFSILCVSLLLAMSDHGITKILTRNTPSSTFALRLIIITLTIPAALGYTLLIGEQLHFYNMQTEIALLIIGNIILLSSIIWINTRVLQHVELENLLIKNELEKNNIRLEINAKTLAEKTLSLEEKNREVSDKLENVDKLFEITDSHE